MIEPFPLIDLSGTPEQRGLQYGRLARERIVRSIAHYSDQISPAVAAVGLSELTTRFRHIIEDFEGDYIVEMQAIAKGADATFDEIMLINARTEIVKLAEALAQERGGGDEPDGCTTVAVLPEAALDATVIHSQNWDWKTECVHTGVVLRIRREDGPDLLTFTEAGALGRSGVNSAGIGITGNYLQSDRDYGQTGVPLALIRRKALEAEYFADAISSVSVTPKSASSNMTLSHRDGIVINCECAPDETFHVFPDKGLLVHANHWISPVALTKLRDTGLKQSPDSLYRDIRVRQILQAGTDRIGLPDVTHALSDAFQSPYSVCRPPRQGMGGTMTTTVAMIHLHVSRGEMSIAPQPSNGVQLTGYSLSDDPSGQQGLTRGATATGQEAEQ